ncbi:MAG: hypothetical protein QOH80_531 [Actinomycetota bacterium]|nr:hypothetical protein [Actinomycetota bacterium]
MRQEVSLVIWVLIVVLPVVPVLILKSLCDGTRMVDLIDAAWRWLRPRPVKASLQPVQQIAADLHRLSQHLEAIDASNPPSKNERLLAAALAYDGVLVDACRTFELPAPEGPPLHPLDRLQTEAALAQEGLVW